MYENARGVEQITGRIDALASTYPEFAGMSDEIKRAEAAGRALAKQEILRNLGEKKDLLFGEIAKKAFPNPLSREVGVVGCDSGLKDYLKTEAAKVASASNTDLWNSAEMVGLKKMIEDLRDGFSRDEEIGTMFADEAMLKIRAGNGVTSLDSIKGPKTLNFKIAYDAQKKEIVVGDVPVDEQATEAGDDPQKIKNGVVELKKGGALLTFVLTFLCGFDPTDKEKGSEEQQYADIVSGKNYVGHMICGLFGFDFAKDSVQTVRGFLPESGQQAFDKATETLRGYKEKIVGPVDDKEIKEVSNFIETLSKSEDASPLLDSVRLKTDETVPADASLLIRIKPGSSIKLNASGGIKVEESGASWSLSSGEEVSAERTARVLRIASEQIIGKGSVFGKGVTVTLGRSKDVLDSSGRADLAVGVSEEPAKRVSPPADAKPEAKAS